MTIIFITIPQLQRNSRNYTRKRTVDFIQTQMNQYKLDNGTLPVTLAEGTAFVNSYLSEITQAFTVTFRDNAAPHSDIPPYDTIYVQYGHWCAAHGGVDTPGDPIATAPGGDTDNQFYAIYTQIENNAIYCIDNG